MTHANNPETERRFPSDAPSEWMNTMHENFDDHWHEPPRKTGACAAYAVIGALATLAAALGLALVSGAGL